LLRLPYPKREFGAPGRRFKPERVKGLTWAEVRHKRQWDADSVIEILLYFDKSRSHWSKKYSLDTYTQMYKT
jgi:hypothetical protein